MPPSSKSAPAAEPLTFSALKLHPALLSTLKEIGYETPSPIQAKAIPPLLEGKDLIGQAQTGTGKTAAFALPLLSRLDLSSNTPQLLVLAPTRELAIQVAEAFQHYAREMKGFHVVPIYGGQDYRVQLKALNRGVQVVVGTPGRVMDHMRRGTLKLDGLQALVLDEADEMLRMGFIDDVEWVLSQLPQPHQTALFSATMPQQIRKIAKTYLDQPLQIQIEAKQTTADTVRQRYWMVSGTHKLDALTRILEAEESDGIIIFTRTKTMTTELAEKLSARGFAADALNGDIPQKLREQLVNKLKSGQLDILIATDVAARGLDVPRISHVINYDVPYDTESYVHRIGRTGRAGREGEAILFIAPREKRLLHAIERATRNKIEEMRLPTHKEINHQRIARFKQRITQALEQQGQLARYREIIEQYRIEQNIPSSEIAAALALLLQGEESLLLEERDDAAERGDRKRKRGKADAAPENGYERYQVAVGKQHKLEKRQLVELVADVTGLFHEDIGTVSMGDQQTTIDLPPGMPRDIFRDLKKSWLCGQKLQIERVAPSTERNEQSARKPKQHKGKSPRRADGNKPPRKGAPRNKKRKGNSKKRER